MKGRDVGRETVMKRKSTHYVRIVLWALLLGSLLNLVQIRSLANEYVGGLSSVRVVGSTSRILVVGSSGSSIPLVGAAPIVETLTPTNTETGVSAILRGRVTDMNGFPSATVYFEWGYGGSLGTTTTSQVVGSTGIYTTLISGLDPGKGISYRIVAQADGTSYGGTQATASQDLLAASYRMVIILPIVWIVIIALAVWGLLSLGTPLILAVVLGALMAQVGAIGARVILESLWWW